MDSAIIVSVISFLGTLVGTAGGIIASGKLTEYRLEQLEKKVEKYTVATAKIPVLEEKLHGFDRRISNIEKESFLSDGYFDGC